MFKLLPLLVLTGLAFGGQSLHVATTAAGSGSFPVQTGACRVEIAFHDWDANASAGHPFDVPACGVNAYFLSGPTLSLQIYWERGAVCDCGGPDIIPLFNLPTKFAYLRFQVDPARRITYAEAWDIQGNRFYPPSGRSGTNSFGELTGTNGGGVTVGSTGQNLGTSFFRIYNTLVPLNSKPPTTAQDTAGCLLQWKFDGNLSDGCGRHNASMSNGGPAYVPSPGQTLVVAKLKTANAPSWSDWTSLRAGHDNQLDASGSYSQADGSDAVTFTWSQLSGPSMVEWVNSTESVPTVRGLSFGTYQLQLVVTDTSGQTATTRLGVGAVAYDDNGVIIPPDPKVTEIFGPMIAFGQNPWGYADERAKKSVELQNAYYKKTGWDPPVWATPAQGTVSYIYAGKGPAPSIPCTALNNAVAIDASSVDVVDASCLSLDSLPTWILIGNAWGTQEMARVCSATASTGPATLTLCYDGRGLSGASFNGTQTIQPKAWPVGTRVAQYKITGDGTLFATDPARPICPAGVPGPPGAITYSIGTVRLRGGSTSITGDGVTWNNNTNVIASYYIRVEATHGGGTPFVYWSRISEVPDPARLVVDRTLPADVDPGPFPYKITSYRYLSLEFSTTDGGKTQLLKLPQGCESETAIYSLATHDSPPLNATLFTGMRFSYKDSLGAQSAFGVNFYGSGLAARAFYLRSGWDFANQTANIMDDYWVRDPELGSGYGGGIPLLQGGGVIGAFANLILNPDTKLSWTDLRRFANSGAIGTWGCNAADSRDGSYLSSWLTLAANYDPDSAVREEWKSRLTAVLNRDSDCKRTDNSWSNGFLFNNLSVPLTMTNGSAIVRGVNIPRTLCFGIANGSLTVTRGSGVFTGTGLVNGSKIVISATKDGIPYTGMFAFKQTAGTAGTLAALWPGDSGEFSYIIENNEYLSTIATGSSDPQMAKNWACTWNSDTQVTLNRNWDGPSESNAHMYSYVLAGFGQQPYMLGIKTTQMKWGSQNDDPAIASRYAELAPLAAAWIREHGYDPNTHGMHYGRVIEACEPLTIATPGTTFDSRTPGCNYGLSQGAIRAARTLTAETSQALRVLYEANPTQENRSWGDEAYGSVWGYCPYTKPGYYCDSNYVRDENSDGALGSYKWTGFFFGMGMAHQWPAARVNTPLR